MGLDISASNNDYMRFNWGGCGAFQDWCCQNQLTNPFIAWNGDNSGSELNLKDNKEHIKMAKAWMKKFKEKYPGLVSDLKPGQRTQIFVWDVWPWEHPEDTQKKIIKRISDNFELGQGAAWYRMLQGAIKNKAIIGYY